MLSAFNVENYRSFADRTRIELRPLTLLFGYNNSGKSALVRALPLIADSMKPDVTGPLNLDSAAARETPFAGLLSKSTGLKTLRLGLEFPDQTTVDYEIAQPAGSPFQELTKVELANPRMGSLTFDLLPRRGTASDYRLAWQGKPTGVVWMRPFVGLAMADARGARFDFDDASIPPASDDLVGSFSSNTQSLGAWGMFWLGSVRKYPDRVTEYRSGSASPRLQSNGDKAAEILALDALEQGPLLADVSGWYERTFQRRLEIVQREDNRFSLTLEPMDVSGSMRVPIADTGEGMAQVLPVLLAAAMARRGDNGDPRLLAFEQPELHLHPDAHAPLATHLCTLAAKDDPPQMLIETHSENFLLGVQLEIASGRLPADRALVYWVRQLEGGSSTVTRIVFDDDGRPHGGWPPGVFSRDMELTRQLIEQRKARKERKAS